MRTCALLIATAGLAACNVPSPTGPATPVPRPAHAAPPPAAEVENWPDATSDAGDWRLRLRPLDGAHMLTVRGPAIPLEVTLLTDDPDVLFAGGPRASVLTPTAELAGDSQWLDEDVSSRLVDPSARAAWVGLPHDPSDERPVDIEIRCRLMLVQEWTAHDLGSLGPGEYDEVRAAPYFLTVGCYPEMVTVTATLPRETRRETGRESGAPGDVRRLLTHAWAAQAAEVRDAHGALLKSTSSGGNQWGSTVAFESGTRDHRLPIAYPVTVRLRVPATFDLEYPSFQWKGLTLPVVPGAAANPVSDRPLDLPPGYRGGDARRSECDAALAATDADARTWQRIAAVLLRSGAYSLRERLQADLAAGTRADAAELLHDLDSWKNADAAAVERMLAECVRERDVHRLVVGMMNAGNDADAACIVDVIADVDPLAALPWLRRERELGRAMAGGGTERRLFHDDLLRRLDRAIQVAAQ